MSDEVKHTIRITRPSSSPGTWYNLFVGHIFKATITSVYNADRNGDHYRWIVSVDDGKDGKWGLVETGDAEEVLSTTLSLFEDLEKRVAILEERLKTP